MALAVGNKLKVAAMSGQLKPKFGYFTVLLH
jgi:hypothetical protein